MLKLERWNLTRSHRINSIVKSAMTIKENNYKIHRIRNERRFKGIIILDEGNNLFQSRKSQPLCSTTDILNDQFRLVQFGQFTRFDFAKNSNGYWLAKCSRSANSSAPNFNPSHLATLFPNYNPCRTFISQIIRNTNILSTSKILDKLD